MACARSPAFLALRPRTSALHAGGPTGRRLAPMASSSGCLAVPAQVPLACWDAVQPRQPDRDQIGPQIVA